MKKKSVSRRAAKKLEKQIEHVRMELSNAVDGSYSVATSSVSESKSGRVKLDLIAGVPAYLSEDGAVSINFQKGAMTPGSLIVTSVISGVTKVLKLIIKYDFLGLDLDEANAVQLLNKAVEYNSTECFKLLLEQPIINKHINGVNGSSVVHVAAYFDRLFMLSILKKAGANFDVVDFDGRTAFQVAIFSRNFKMAGYLLKFGSNIDAISPKHGLNAMHVAIIVN